MSGANISSITGRSTPPRGCRQVRIVSPVYAAWAPSSARAMWARASQSTSWPGPTRVRTASTLAIEPVGVNSAASWPNSSASRSSSTADGRVLAVDVVAHLGVGHRPPHRGGRAGQGVAAQIDHGSHPLILSAVRDYPEQAADAARVRAGRRTASSGACDGKTAPRRRPGSGRRAAPTQPGCVPGGAQALRSISATRKASSRRLHPVEPRVADRLVAVAEVDLGELLAAADALGDVVAGELDVDAAGPGAERAVHVEEALDLLDDVVEAAGLVARGRLEGVAVHRVAHPGDLDARRR